jgi:hypothetical protein
MGPLWISDDPLLPDVVLVQDTEWREIFKKNLMRAAKYRHNGEWRVVQFYV